MTAADTVVGQLDWQEQQDMLAAVRRVVSASRLVRPVTPSGLPMRVRVTAAGKLGWVGDARGYRYSREDATGKPWPVMPAAWAALATKFSGERLQWDSAIINWYDPEASLGWHQDRSELDTSLPIVTFSLGDACSWAVRRDDHDPATRVRLESGAVTLLAGPTRAHWHTVERIIANPLLSPLRTRGRISVRVGVAGEP